jgi:putative transposase
MVIEISKKISKASVRSCSRVLGQRRSTLYYLPKRINCDEEIAFLLRQKAIENPCWGFRLLYYSFRNEGKTWGKNRVYRIYKAEKLNLRVLPHRKKVKRKALNMLPAKQINQGWSMDFLSDVLEGEKKKVRILNILDECSRKALITWGQYSISAKKLVGVLNELIQIHGIPSYLRCDNGPEFISKELKKFTDKHQIELKFSAPGKPTQNGLVERLNGTLRKECLNLNYYKTLEHLQQDLDKWWNKYNFERPHSSLGYLTPQKFIDNNQNLQFQLVAA